MQHLPPISVGASVDKMFANRYKPNKPWLSRVCSKNHQTAASGQLGTWITLEIRGFQWFSTVAVKLYPKSVGASVDKVFAIR